MESKANQRNKPNFTSNETNFTSNKTSICHVMSMNQRKKIKLWQHRNVTNKISISVNLKVVSQCKTLRH